MSLEYIEEDEDEEAPTFSNVTKGIVILLFFLAAVGGFFFGSALRQEHNPAQAPAGVPVWEVHWISKHKTYPFHEDREEVEFFLNENEAKQFRAKLVAAFKAVHEEREVSLSRRK